MLPTRFVGLLLVLFVTQAWCKPTKSSESEDYHDDDPPPDYESEPIEDDDEPGTSTEPPQILSKPKVIHAKNGSTVSLPCIVKNTENVAVSWKRNNETLYYDSFAVTNDTRRIVRLQNNSLVIHNVTVNDMSDNYECSILEKPAITIRHRLIIDVDTSPIRVTPGSTVQVTAGEKLVLGCMTTMQPPPKIKWYRKIKKSLVLNDGMPTNHLTIKNVTRHNSGEYYCLAEDGSERPPVQVISVVVNYPPEIEVERDSVHTGLHVESNLTCKVYAHPAARVRWFKNQKEIQPEPRRIELKTVKPLYTLKIADTKEQDLGEYKCVAENKFGQAEKSIVLTGSPSEARIESGGAAKTNRGLILRWRLDSFSPITEYVLKYRRKGETNWIILKPTVTNGKGIEFTVEHEIEELQPGSYEATLEARNEYGWSQPSKPYIFMGEEVIEEAENVQGQKAAASQPTLALATLLLVISSCAFTSL
ncbi:protein amalgam [Nomia melanderi]|uniref:protein amalgam n=1 Tax=Nomia melanderi TaxID=2448451 RepID=UPI0013045563|nr:neurotrimin-like [Nomia melanderi]